MNEAVRGNLLMSAYPLEKEIHVFRFRVDDEIVKFFGFNFF